MTLFFRVCCVTSGLVCSVDSLHVPVHSLIQDGFFTHPSILFCVSYIVVLWILFTIIVPKMGKHAVSLTEFVLLYVQLLPSFNILAGIITLL